MPGIQLTDDMVEMISRAIDTDNVMVLAVVDKNNRPSLTFRGSTAVYGPDQLSLWVRNAGGDTIRAIEHNPHVAMMYRSKSVPFLEFRGRARVVADPEEKNRVFDLAHEKEQQGDPERKGTAVIIDLDRVNGVIGFDDNGPVWCNMER
jgi:general stress protein 26